MALIKCVLIMVITQHNISFICKVRKFSFDDQTHGTNSLFTTIFYLCLAEFRVYPIVDSRLKEIIKEFLIHRCEPK